VAGEWFGQGATKLTLEGRVGQKEFLSLCENRDPSSGKTLTKEQAWENMALILGALVSAWIRHLGN
jgi:hypothetical protein